MAPIRLMIHPLSIIKRANHRARTLQSANESNFQEHTFNPTNRPIAVVHTPS